MQLIQENIILFKTLAFPFLNTFTQKMFKSFLTCMFFFFIGIIDRLFLFPSFAGSFFRRLKKIFFLVKYSLTNIVCKHKIDLELNQVECIQSDWIIYKKIYLIGTFFLSPNSEMKLERILFVKGTITDDFIISLTT